MSNSDVKKSYLAFEHSCFLCVLFLFIFFNSFVKSKDASCGCLDFLEPNIGCMTSY